MIIPPLRRMAIAVVSLSASALLLHAPLADALVTRGDDALRAGDVAHAVGYYERARWFDRTSPVASDRLAFYLTLRRAPGDARLARRIASAAIALHPTDAALIADRAFADLQLRAWGDAERDFDRAALLTHDARYDHFAAQMALRTHDRVAARRYAHRALSDDPHFAPASALLATIGQ